MILFGSYWNKIVFVLAVIAIAIAVGRILRFLIGRFFRIASFKIKVDPTKYSFLKNAVEFIVYIIALIIIFYSIPELRSYGTALFAGAGVLAAFLGFASQSAFSNIVGGVFIVIFRPFSVGDRVKVGNTYNGDVEDITLRHTVIKDFENRRIVIPNSVINNETIINSTLFPENICIFLELTVSFESNLDVAMRIMGEVSSAHPFCQDNRSEQEKSDGEPVVKVRVIQINEVGVQIRASVWAATPSAGFEMKCDLLKSIKQHFDEAGISLAYPQRLINIRNHE